ncbi:cell filamentation protein Fic [Ventosimonas gracilis]|uniref:Cell filamentation protein Fic n=1 Tax=Ventosimonas gracilis TaxID=1680762 RepID=A0A139SYA3_9GAMM|nr:Fic family protein [Ventosimonas gracilis]KXU39370.1 cell filamentation protein Fic [Ventosimonas gracilis]
MNADLKNRLPFLYQAIEAAKAVLDAARPLPSHTAASLRDKLSLEWTYHSNAIEGNTLTLRETKVVLEGITVGGKSLREHFEAINHRDAILYVEEIVAREEALTQWQIKNIHNLVLKGIDDGQAGRYRRENVVISGASTTPPDFLHLDEAMQQLIAWHEQADQMHPIARASELHTRFVEIHPFVDGNGRTGRLLLNFELMKAGYPPAVIRKDDRLAYYDALDEACLSKNYEAITTLIAEAVQRSLDLYLNLLGSALGREPGDEPDSGH